MTNRIKKPNFSLGNKPIAMKALELAARHHSGIVRKYDGEPYINHPIRVAETLLRYGFTDERMLAAALLHDCLEDENANGVKMPDRVISNNCDLKVLRWVQLLTNTERGNRAERKEKAAVRIATAPPEVQAIKLADIMDNCTGIAKIDPEFAEVYIAEKERLLRKLRPINDDRFSRLYGDVKSMLSREMYEVGLYHLATGQERQAKEQKRDEQIAAIISEEERTVYAEVGLF